MNNPLSPILCACGCGTPFTPGASNGLYATRRCQQRMERRRRRDREVNGPRFSAAQIAATKLADWHKEQAENERNAGAPDVFDPVQAAIDAAQNQQ